MALHESAHHIPMDGAAYQAQPILENGAKSVQIVNGSTVGLFVWDDTGFGFQLAAGKVVTIGILPSQTFWYQAASAAPLVNGKPPYVMAIYYEGRRPTSGSFT